MKPLPTVGVSSFLTLGKEALAFAGPRPFSSGPPALLPRLPSCSQAISSCHPAPSGQPASPTLHKPAGGTGRIRITLPSRSHLAKHVLQKPCPTGRQHSYVYNRNPFQHAHGSAWICSGSKVLAALIFQTLDMIPEFSLVGSGWEPIHSFILFIHSFIQWWLTFSTIVSRVKTQSLRQTNKSKNTKNGYSGDGLEESRTPVSPANHLPDVRPQWPEFNHPSHPLDSVKAHVKIRMRSDQTRPWQ